MDNNEVTYTMDSASATMYNPSFDAQPHYNVAIADYAMQPQYEEYDTPIEQPYRPDKYGAVSNRMLILLVWAVAMAGLAVTFIGPRIGIGANGERTGILNNVVEAVVGAPIVAQPAGYTGISPIFSREVQHWAPNIVRWAADFDLDPDMVATVMQIESCGDPGAESWVGAQGLFQVMPFHFSADENMIDPDTNARRGMNYLAERLVQTGGEVGHAFAGYNGGHGAAATTYDNWYAETQAYYNWSTGIYQEAKDGKTSSETLARWMDAGGANLCASARSRLGIQ